MGVEVAAANSAWEGEKIPTLTSNVHSVLSIREFGLIVHCPGKLRFPCQLYFDRHVFRNFDFPINFFCVTLRFLDQFSINSLLVFVSFSSILKVFGGSGKIQNGWLSGPPTEIMRYFPRHDVIISLCRPQKITSRHTNISELQRVRWDRKDFLYFFLPSPRQGN